MIRRASKGSAGTALAERFARRRRSMVSFLFVIALAGLAGCEHVGIFEPAREVECLQRARVSLKQAIAAAEAGGGKALDADYTENRELGCLSNDPGFYAVTLLTAGRISVVSVNAGSGQVGPREEQGVMNALMSGGMRFEGSAADMARMLPSLAIDMSQAVDIAERQGGKILSAWIEAQDGRPGYTVKVVQNSRVRVTWIAGDRTA
jgi:uncharacterized membrane protein YkoI